MRQDGRTSEEEEPLNHSQIIKRDTSTCYYVVPAQAGSCRRTEQRWGLVGLREYGLDDALLPCHEEPLLVITCHEP